MAALPRPESLAQSDASSPPAHDAPRPVDESARPARHARGVRYWGLLKQAANDWLEDNAMRLAASLAFYTMLSLAPLLVIAIKVVGAIFGEDAARTQIKNYSTDLMGAKAADAIAAMAGYKLSGGLIATIVSAVVLIVSSGSVFGELQDALNTVWEVKPKPGRAWWTIIRERFFSYMLVLGACFLLLVSLIISAALAGVTRWLHPGQSIAWSILYFLISIGVVTCLFAMLFKYLPDVKILWRDVWVGALVTGLLFSIGKLVLGWYLGRASTTSVYGAAGSLVAMLLWVYYSAQILFFGAELTRAYARRTRGGIKAADNAVKVTEEERAQQGIPDPNRVQALAEEKTRREQLGLPTRSLSL